MEGYFINKKEESFKEESFFLIRIFASHYFYFMNNKPTLHTSFSPSLINLYNVSNSIVVIIDVLRATSTK